MVNKHLQELHNQTHAHFVKENSIKSSGKTNFKQVATVYTINSVSDYVNISVKGNKRDYPQDPKAKYVPTSSIMCSLSSCSWWSCMSDPRLGRHPRRFSSPLTYTLDVSTTGPWNSAYEVKY